MTAGMVAILMGGPSEEHDVSLRSGQGVAEALGRRGYRAMPVVIPRELGTAQAESFTREALRGLSPDAVFIALHGRFGEDGAVQQVCESLHLPFTGSDAAASRLGMDKIASRERFVRAGLAVPRWRMVQASRADLSLLRGLRYPLIVKPVDQGSSIGLSKVVRPEELAAALALAGTYSETLLVEDYVRGRELTVGMLDDMVLPVVEIRPKHQVFDFAAKYTPGMTAYDVPARLPAAVARAVQAAGQRAHEAIGCRHLSRTDIMLNDAQVPVVLEVNTIPGFTPTSLLPKAAACAGLSYDDVCERLTLLALHAATPLVRSDG